MPIVNTDLVASADQLQQEILDEMSLTIEGSPQNAALNRAWLLMNDVAMELREALE